MEVVMQGKVTGMKSFKGTIEGEDIDSCTVFVEAVLKGDGSKGYASQKYAWGKSENAKKLQHLEFPFVAEVRCENVTDGRGGASLRVVDIRPLARTGQPAPGQKAA